MSETQNQNLYGETDAAMWAAEFCRLNPSSVPDEGTMIGWFANAIESGREAGRVGATPVNPLEAHIQWLRRNVSREAVDTKPIQAIKDLRGSFTPTPTLKEAKDAVDAYRASA